MRINNIFDIKGTEFPAGRRLVNSKLVCNLPGYQQILYLTA
ncbi:hypothetical protein [Tepidanaerobacter acetatoxydans]|nr:hypothetical protein [Tepidanaerobacter acetatoxydans]